MTFNAYKLFNLAEFEATGLVSRTLDLFLDGIGQKQILITKGNAVSILYEGIFLSLGLGGLNPFVFEGHAVFVDPNGDVWLGIENET